MKTEVAHKHFGILKSLSVHVFHANYVVALYNVNVTVYDCAYFHV